MTLLLSDEKNGTKSLGTYSSVLIDVLANKFHDVQVRDAVELPVGAERGQLAQLGKSPKPVCQCLRIATCTETSMLGVAGVHNDTITTLQFCLLHRDPGRVVNKRVQLQSSDLSHPDQIQHHCHRWYFVDCPSPRTSHSTSSQSDSQFFARRLGNLGSKVDVKFIAQQWTHRSVKV